MKLSKFLSFVCVITLFSLLYIYQQTEIFCLAYAGQKKLECAQDLLDKNHILRYNIETGTSVVRLNTKMSDYADFQMPESYRLVRLEPSGQGLAPQEGQQSSNQALLSKIFGIKRQAEAKTINP